MTRKVREFNYRRPVGSLESTCVLRLCIELLVNGNVCILLLWSIIIIIIIIIIVSLYHSNNW